MNAISSPSQAACLAAYSAGRGTLIWSTYVADLETPVAAYMKLAAGRPNSFLLESIENGSARSRYSIIGMTPDLVWRCRAGVAELNRHARSAPHAFVPDERPALESLRAIIAETRMDIPDHLPPMLGGLVGYLGYDMVRQMERLPAKNTDALGVPEAILLRPTLFAVFDNVRDELTLAAPDLPAARRPRRRRLVHRAGGARRGVGGAAAAPAPRRAPGRAAAAARARVEHDQGRVHGDRRAHEGIHLRRRRVPGRAEPALLRAVRAAAVRALSLAAPGQPGAVPVLPRLRRLLHRRQLARDPGAAARRHRDHPAAGRHPQARRHEGRGRGAGTRPAVRPEGAGRAPDAARPRPQRRRPGVRARHRARGRELRHRAVQPRHAHLQHGRGQAEGPASTRSTR